LGPATSLKAIAKRNTCFILPKVIFSYTLKGLRDVISSLELS